MDDNLEETRSENSGQVKNQEFGDPELNSEPEVPVIPSSEPEHEPAATPAYNTAIPRKRNPKRLLYLIAAVFVIFFFFFFFLKIIRGNKKSAPTPTPLVIETSTPTPTQNTTPTPTSSPPPHPVYKTT